MNTNKEKEDQSMDKNIAMLDSTREYLIVLSPGVTIGPVTEVGPNKAQAFTVSVAGEAQIVPREGPARIDDVERKAVFFVSIPKENIPLP